MPSWPKGYAFIKDQIRRASSSAVLNLVEGNGRVTLKDRRRFFIQSSASVCEVGGCLELIGIYHPDYVTKASDLQQQLKQIYAMVWKMK